MRISLAGPFFYYFFFYLNTPPLRPHAELCFSRSKFPAGFPPQAFLPDAPNVADRCRRRGMSHLTVMVRFKTGSRGAAQAFKQLSERALTPVKPEGTVKDVA